MFIVKRSEALEFIRFRTERSESISFIHLTEEFPLSPEAACDHLKRLWRDRLIEATSPRPTGFRYRPKQNESILHLRFRLSSRGRERLRWYLRKEDDLGEIL